MKSTMVIIFAILALCLVANGNPMPKALYREPTVPKDESYEPSTVSDQEEENVDADENFAVERDSKR